MLDRHVRVVEAQVMDPKRPILTFVVRDAFERSPVSGCCAGLGHIITEPQCLACRRVLSWLHFADKPDSLNSTNLLSPLVVAKLRKEVSERDIGHENKQLRDASQSTVLSSASWASVGTGTPPSDVSD
jgi:hypothetical protein